jgi:hypothetical protein
LGFVDLKYVAEKWLFRVGKHVVSSPRLRPLKGRKEVDPEKLTAIFHLSSVLLLLKH